MSLQGDIESLASSIPKAQAAAEEAKQRLTLRKAEMEAEINAEISKRRTELNSLKETLAAGGDRVDADGIEIPRPGYRQADLHQHGGRRRQTRRSNHGNCAA